MSSVSDLTDQNYQKAREWITDKFNSGTSWDRLMSQPTSRPLGDFLQIKEEDDGWPHISPSEWKTLVEQQKEAEEKAVSIDIKSNQAIVIDGTSNNSVTLPDKPFSCWQLYKAKLGKDGFSSQAIDEIERATLKILKRLSDDTRDIGPIKGLVIGNVQSG